MYCLFVQLTLQYVSNVYTTSIPRKTSPLDVLPVSTEGLRGYLRTGHHHTRQLTADRKVPSTLRISAGTAATEEGGARQVVARQLQADI